MKIIGLLVLSLTLASPASAQQKTHIRLCWCLKHGTQGGCLRWTCRVKHRPVAVPTEWRLGDFE